MKIHLILLSSILTILLLTGCGAPLETVPLEDEEIEEILVDLVQEYKTEMVRVVNTGSFGELDHFLIQNHTYRNIRAYVNDMKSKQIKLNLVEQSIVGVCVGYQDEIEIYCVDVTEIVEEIDKDGNIETIERDLRYEIISHHNDFRIESIIGRK